MSSEPQRYVENPPSVMAMEVTADTIDDVASWCGGTVMPDDTIMVRSGTVAFFATIGDYIVQTPRHVETGGGYSIVPKNEFEKQWSPA